MRDPHPGHAVYREYKKGPAAVQQVHLFCSGSGKVVADLQCLAVGIDEVCFFCRNDVYCGINANYK